MRTIATTLAAMLAVLVAATACGQTSKVATLEQAQTLAGKALKAAADRCRALVGGGVSDRQAGDHYFAMRVRCTDDAYLAVVDRATGSVETMRCRVARARYGGDAKASCATDSAAKVGTQYPAGWERREFALLLNLQRQSQRDLPAVVKTKAADDVVLEYTDLKRILEVANLECESLLPWIGTETLLEASALGFQEVEFSRDKRCPVVDQ